MQTKVYDEGGRPSERKRNNILLFALRCFVYSLFLRGRPPLGKRVKVSVQKKKRLTRVRSLVSFQMRTFRIHLLTSEELALVYSSFGIGGMI